MMRVSVSAAILKDLIVLLNAHYDNLYFATFISVSSGKVFYSNYMATISKRYNN